MSPASENRPEATGTARLAMRAGYGAAFFVASAGALVMEITAGRLLAPYVGMSLYSWTAIIAVVLAGLSLGNWCGGYLSERPAGRQASWIGLAFALAAASSLLSLILLRQLSGPILGLGLGTVPSVLAISGAAFFLPAFFPGLVGPPLTRRAIALAPGREGRALGQMFALGTLGAIAGTLASGYIFIAWLGSTGTVLAISAIYAVPAVVFVIAGRRQGGKGGGAAALAFLAALTAGLVLLGERSGAFTSPCDRESQLLLHPGVRRRAPDRPAERDAGARPPRPRRQRPGHARLFLERLHRVDRPGDPGPPGRARGLLRLLHRRRRLYPAPGLAGALSRGGADRLRDRSRGDPDGARPLVARPGGLAHPSPRRAGRARAVADRGGLRRHHRRCFSRYFGARAPGDPRVRANCPRQLEAPGQLRADGDRRAAPHALPVQRPSGPCSRCSPWSRSGPRWRSSNRPGGSPIWWSPATRRARPAGSTRASISTVPGCVGRPATSSPGSWPATLRS